MVNRTQSELEISVRLQQAGIESREEWDMLVFLHRRYQTLLSVEHIAQVLGYQLNTTMTVLGRLQALGLIERSALRQGIRLWQLSRSASARTQVLHQLLAMEDQRAVRRLLTQLQYSASSSFRSAQEEPDDRQ